MADRFSRLLQPVGPALFFERYWGREYLHLSRSASDFHGDILRIEDIDVFLQSEQLPAAFVNVVSAGVKHPVEEWSRVDKAARGEVRVACRERLLELYRNGATLVLNQAHHAFPGLSGLCSSLTRESGLPVQANIYITPPGCQGFSRHTDGYEILILAIWGGKSFSLYPQGCGPVEIDLKAGDLLYIPRGLVHEARSVATASIHVSLGLKPTYGFQLLEQIAAMARSHADFQQIVPLQGASETARQRFREEFLERVQRLVAGIKLETMAAGRFRELVDKQPKGWSSRLSDILRIQDMTLDTILVARGGILTSIEEAGADLHIHFGGNRVSVPGFFRISLEQVLSGVPFAIREIQGMVADAGKVDFLRPFVQSGLLSIVSSEEHPRGFDR